MCECQQRYKVQDPDTKKIYAHDVGLVEAKKVERKAKAGKAKRKLSKLQLENLRKGREARKRK